MPPKFWREGNEGLLISGIDMDKYIESIIRSLAIIFIVIFSLRAINVYEEKTRLEIEKLKYELSIYKENEESLK